MFRITKVFGREKFYLPPKQSEQYHRIFPNTPTEGGLVVCYTPQEWRVEGEGLWGTIIEHPTGRLSVFVHIQKYPGAPGDRSSKGISFQVDTLEEAKEKIISEATKYRAE